jgi:hypothetical protein
LLALVASSQHGPYTRNQRKMSKSHINKAQAVCLEVYANGEFSHLLELDSKTALDLEIADCGDTLLKFLMIELSTSEDCDGTDTAIARIATAMNDLKTVQDAIGALPEKESCPAAPRG